MGRARIYSHLGGGLYRAAYWRDVTKAKVRLEAIQEQKQRVFDEIYGANGLVYKRDAAENKLLYHKAQFDAKLSEWAACAQIECPNEAALKSEMIELNRKRQDAAAEYAGMLAVISLMNAQLLQLNEEVGRLQSLSTDKEFEEREIWCVDFPHADYGPIAPGTVVGTTESYGAIGMQYGNEDMEMPDPHINILPSYANEATFDAGRDKPAQTLMGMTTAEACMNTLQFLYVADQNPSYCVGTLTSKDNGANTGTVVIDGSTPISREPKEFVQKTLTNVPIVYQTCGASVFEVGDEVVVKFGAEKFGSPTVIGFAQNPRECANVTLDYSCDTGGYISGDANQTIRKGQDGTQVEVTITSPTMGFVGWSDGAAQGLRRQDLDVLQNINVRAKLVDWGTWPAYINIWVATMGTGLTEAQGASWYGGFMMGPGSTSVNAGGVLETQSTMFTCTGADTVGTFSLWTSKVILLEWGNDGFSPYKVEEFWDGYSPGQGKEVWKPDFHDDMYTNISNVNSGGSFSASASGVSWDAYNSGYDGTVVKTTMDCIYGISDCPNNEPGGGIFLEGYNRVESVPAQQMIDALMAEGAIPSSLNLRSTAGSRRLYANPVKNTSGDQRFLVLKYTLV